MSTTLCILLCAGHGSRYDGSTHKLLAPLGGSNASSSGASTVFEHSLQAARASDIGPVVVITGAVELPVIQGVEYVHNPRFSSGQGTSLRLALDLAAQRNMQAVVCGLGDQPLVQPGAWRAVAAERRTPISVATYGGQRRNPVRLASSVWPLIDGVGDHGARELIALRPELVTEVTCAGFDLDVDTLEDLQAAARLLAEQGNESWNN